MEMKNEWVKDPKIFNVNRLSAKALKNYKKNKAVSIIH